MPDLDVDRARGVGVAVPPKTADEYAEKSAQLQPGFLATADASDPGRGWTVQHRDNEAFGDTRRGYVQALDTLPGQVYTVEQLPDPEAAIAAGVPPVQIPADLVVDDPYHIQGPEPSERAILNERAKLRVAVVDHLVERKDEADGAAVAPEVQKSKTTKPDTTGTPGAGPAPGAPSNS